MSKATEHKWAGELSGMAFLLEGILAGAFEHSGPKALREFGEAALGQWGNGSVKTPDGMSPFDAALIHQAGTERIKKIFNGALERLGGEQLD